METSFYQFPNRNNIRAKTFAVVALAVVGTMAACFLVYNYTANSSQMIHTNPTALYDLYHHWKQAHGYRWGASEDQHRFGVFQENYKIINNHNSNNHSYTLGLNAFAAMTCEEFSSIYLGYQAHEKSPIEERDIELHNTDDLEDSVDWTTKGAVTPVKNQGQCGSCWAFSTTGSLEGLNFITNKKLVSLSEQELVDCAGSYGNQGCNGGLMDYGFQYAADKGIASEESYPYTAADGNCQTNKKVFQNKGFKDVKKDDVDQLKAAIAKGPVSVAIEADTSAFQLYKDGVLTGDACGTQLDHGVLAVGYGTLNGKAYFKVKNSWGESWGNSGYVFVGATSGSGVCGINSDPSYPTA